MNLKDFNAKERNLENFKELVNWYADLLKKGKLNNAADVAIKDSIRKWVKELKLKPRDADKIFQQALKESKEDMLKKAMATIDKQFNKSSSKPSPVSKPDKNKYYKDYKGFLKFMIADYELQKKAPLVKMFKKKLDQLEKGELEPKDPYANVGMDINKQSLFMRLLDIQKKIKDKDAKNYLKNYLKRAEKYGVLKKWPTLKPDWKIESKEYGMNKKLESNLKPTYIDSEVMVNMGPNKDMVSIMNRRNNKDEVIYHSSDGKFKTSKGSNKKQMVFNNQKAALTYVLNELEFNNELKKKIFNLVMKIKLKRSQWESVMKHKISFKSTNQKQLALEHLIKQGHKALEEQRDVVTPFIGFNTKGECKAAFGQLKEWNNKTHGKPSHDLKECKDILEGLEGYRKEGKELKSKDAKRGVTIQNKKNPEWGTFFFTQKDSGDNWEIAKSKRPSDVRVLFDDEFKFWEIVKESRNVYEAPEDEKEKEFWKKETMKAIKQLMKLKKETINSAHALEVLGSSDELDKFYDGKDALEQILKKGTDWLKKNK